MSGSAKKIKILSLCMVLLLCAGMYGTAVTSRQRVVLAEQTAAAQLVATQQTDAAASEAPQEKEALQTAAQTQSGRDDLMEEVSFDTEEETVITEMGKDFAVDGMKPAGGRVKTVQANTDIKDCLFTVNDCRAYSFTVTERGVLQLHFSYNFSEVAGTPWIVYLYEAYASDGSGDNDSYRRLDMFSVTSVENKLKESGEKIGVYPGTYLILVRVGDICSVDEYTLHAEFTTGLAWEAEPNDSITRYNELPLNIKTGGCCSGKTGGDVDWYMIELPERGIVNLVFEHHDEQLPQVGWFVTMQDGAGNIFYQARSYYKDSMIESGEIGLEPGVYFIKISPHIHISTDYFITCKYEAISTYETEPNDTLETADVILLNGNECGVSGSLSDKNTLPDKDYYRFEPDRAGVMSFSFIHQNYVRNRDGWKITLTDANGRVLYQTVSKWCDMVIGSPQIGLDAGTYYLSVDSENMLLNSGTYIIGINFASGENWETENNDTFDTADEIDLNRKVYGSLIAMGNDYDADVFCFEQTKTAPVQFVFAHNGMAQDYEGWVISLYNADRKKITGFSSKWSDVETASELMNLAPGKYYIMIETGARFSDLKYSIEVRS